MVTHQSRNMLLTNHLNFSNRQNVLDALKMISDELIPILDKIRPLIQLYGDVDQFVQFNKRMNGVIGDYMEILHNLLPVISSIDDYRQELLSKEYIISYGPLFELTSLYQKMVELFCVVIDLIIGINNAYNRGNYEIFSKGFNRVTWFLDVINSYNSKY